MSSPNVDRGEIDSFDTSNTQKPHFNFHTSEKLKQVLGTQPTQLSLLPEMVKYMDQYGNVDSVLNSVFEKSVYSPEFIQAVRNNPKIRGEIAFSLAQASSETRLDLIALDVSTRIRAVAEKYRTNMEEIQQKVKLNIWMAVTGEVAANDETPFEVAV